MGSCKIKKPKTRTIYNIVKLTHRLGHAMDSGVRFLEWMGSLSEAVKPKSKLYWRARIWKMPEVWDACSGKKVHSATEWTQPNQEAARGARAT